MLLNGRALVIFDGLDELLDTSYRQEISSDIECFCSLYPSVPIIVTSREIGYEQAPLDEKMFEVFRLAPFDTNQVKQYVRNWFYIDTDLSFEQKSQKVESFLRESEIVSDLRSNPLMLALMCNIYRGENYIPRNRPDVYEKCATMLFERWDKSRGIKYPGDVEEIEAHIKPMMMHLAYYIYSNESLQSGVTEKNLIDHSTSYLFEKRFEDIDEAERAAKNFIEFCRGRAWVFTDIGTTKDGESLYQFTHRTFLEYFAAAYLVRINPIPDKLISILKPKIIKREWDVVAQLAFQIQNKNVEGAADQLLTILMELSKDCDNICSMNITSFAARSLEFLIPSPKVVRDITAVSMDKLLLWGLNRFDSRKRNSGYEALPKSNPTYIISSLLNSAIENRKTIKDEMEKKTISKINDGSDKEAILMAEVGLHIQLFILRRKEISPGTGTRELCDLITENILKYCGERILKLSMTNMGLGMDLTKLGKMGMKEFVNLYGPENLFRKRHYILFPNAISVSIFERLNLLLENAPYQESSETFLLDHIDYLEEIGSIFLNLPAIAKKSGLSLFSNERSKKKIKHNKLFRMLSNNSDALFGVFILLASLLEASNDANIIKFIEDLKVPPFQQLYIVLITRYANTEKEIIEKELCQLSFSWKQQDYIWKWVQKEKNIFL
ncbi:MAG: hypothetical protein WB392_12680 [Methanotrichaceae archaeon]